MLLVIGELSKILDQVTHIFVYIIYNSKKQTLDIYVIYEMFQGGFYSYGVLMIFCYIFGWQGAFLNGLSHSI